MSLVGRIKKFPPKVISRAKYDDLLYTLLQIGAASLAVSAPAIAAVAIYVSVVQRREGGYTKHKLKNSFYYFRKAGLISIESRHGNTCIALTKEGEQRARLCGIGKILSGNLVLEDRRWDGKWRIVFFDLRTEKTKERDAIRLMLKRCGFIFLQKSVWIYPYNCSDEVEFLRSFFRLEEEEFRLVTSDDIGDDSYFRKHFSLPLFT